ncbi:hypothetical protein [Cerasicoccus frondis]|uniref:hypothetical protein n=1 Tax=Cerasicoccus frondis TaxID=490090 RepID=UPI0028525C8E|nr:hypothetical protein [Cerasicoccus frondis]
MKQLQVIAMAASAALIFTAPLFADKPTDKGKPADVGNAANESSYQYVEQEIAKEQQLLNEEDANEKAKLQKELAKEMQKKDGFDAKSKGILDTYLKENKGSWKNKSSLPPGLQKKVARGGDLPPGWQKKLGLGDVIPNDIFDHARPLPKDIAEKIPHPAGTEDVQIEDEIYRVTKKTRQIIDIISAPVSQ